MSRGPPVWNTELSPYAEPVPPPVAPVPPILLFAIDTDRPNTVPVRSLPGLAKLGWLRMLNRSPRKTRVKRSVMWKERRADKSTWVNPKPRKELRPRFPCRVALPLASVGGILKALGLKAFPPGYCDP